MQKLTVSDLMSLERYSRERPDFRTRVIAHKRNRQLNVGPNTMWLFEDRLTVQYQVQEMLRTERIFEAEFDQAYEEGGLFNLTMHPHVTGHRSRIVGFEKLIRHMKSKPGVWFATEEQIARYVKTNAGS